MQDFDPDTDAIALDEMRATAALALVALQRGQRPALATPLQREMAAMVSPIWTDHQHRQVRTLLAAMRERVRH